jgi:hypothetical protein
MRIGILGSGLMGGKLGTLFARAGAPARPVKIVGFTWRMVRSHRGQEHARGGRREMLC